MLYCYQPKKILKFFLSFAKFDINMNLLIFIMVVFGTFARSDASCIPGSSWKQGNDICHCNKWGVQKCYHDIGICAAWGDPHFTSFDNKNFDFQGKCRYVLARDCCTKNFTVEAELIEWSATTSVTDKITIRFGTNRVVTLEKVNVLKVDTNVYPGLFYDDPEVRCEMVNGFMFVTLKNLAVWVRWNFHFHVRVYVHSKYKNQMCGLCGDFNGDSSNDLTLSPTGEPVTTINEWGESWRTVHKPARCKCEDELNNDNPPCGETPEHAQQMNLCDDVIGGDEFAECRAVIDPGPFIEDCKTEMCACAETDKKGCICQAVSAYIEACENAGFIISDSWIKADYECDVCKVGDNIYQHGTSWRVGCTVYTCNNGVYLPPTTLANCCCDLDLNQWFLNGQTWTYECEIRKCEQGQIISTDSELCCHERGKTYHHGQTWQNGCYIKECKFSNIVTSIDPDCCFANGSHYPPGGSYSPNDCESCTCTAGEWHCLPVPILCPLGYKYVAPCSCVPVLEYFPKLKHALE